MKTPKMVYQLWG